MWRFICLLMNSLLLSQEFLLGVSMRVLIVHPHLSSGGGSIRVVKNFSRCLEKRGIESSVMTLTPCGNLEGGYEGSDLYFPASYGYRSSGRSSGLGEGLRLIKDIISLSSMLKRYAEDYDVVNLYNFPSTWAAYGITKPVVWMFNEPGDVRANLRRSLLLRAVYGLGVSMDKYIINKFIDTICVGDDSNRDRVKRRYGREPHIIPYGMDIGVSFPEKNNEIRDLYGLGSRFVVLHPGMISPQKNQLESLKAIERLRKKIKDIVLVFTGISPRGAYRKAIDAYVSEKGLEKHVIFTGHLREDVSRQLYRTSDVTVFPEKTEGGWLYPFEVITSGAPLVVSRAFAASGLIAREKLGLVTDDISCAIEYIFLNPGKTRETSERAFAWVRKNFGWDNFTGQMVDVFNSVIP